MALVGLLLPAPAAASPVQDPGRVERVLLFSLPRIGWVDLEGADLPNLRALLEVSTVSQLSHRTVGSRTTLSDGYATVGAGNRANGVGLIGELALARDEQIEGRYAAEAFASRTGVQTEAAIFHLGIAQVRQRNNEGYYDAMAGALGSALRGAGYSTAVIANADTEETQRRSAALAMMDTVGVVEAGEVSPALVTPDPSAPYGARMNFAAAEQAFTTVWADREVVLVEASDLERVDLYASLALPEAWRELRRQTIAEADRLLGALLEQVDLSRHLVIVFTPASPRSGEQLGVFAMAGPGVEPGVGVSASTRREGYVTLPDIAPTILNRLGVEVPPSMTGTPVTWASPTPVDEAIEEFIAANEVALFQAANAGRTTVFFIVLQLVAYAVTALMLLVPRLRMRPIAQFLLLMVVAFSPLTFLSGLFRYDQLGVGGYIAVLFAASAVLAGIAMLVGRLCARWLGTAAPLLPPLLLVGGSWLMMAIDIFTGGRLQLSTMFGYSPIVAGRFSGFGNLAFSMIAAGAVVVVTGIWAVVRLRADRGGTAGATRQVGFTIPLILGIVLLLLTIVIDGHPSFGSDVGGVLATVPGFAVVVLLLGGWRVNIRRLLLVGAATVAAIGTFAVIDLNQPAEERTHLGRLVERMSDPGAVATVIDRKIHANLGLLTRSLWTWMVPIAAVLLIVMISRRTRALQQLRKQIPGLDALLWGGGGLAFLGFALNDSGIAVPAMMSTIVVPYLGYLALRTSSPEPAKPAKPTPDEWDVSALSEEVPERAGALPTSVRSDSSNSR